MRSSMPVLRLLLLVWLVIPVLLAAQEKRLISGTIIDNKTNAPLPYVTLGLKKLLIGVVTNEDGKFDLYVPKEQSQGDTLFVNYLGYKPILIPLSALAATVTIKLEETVVQLDEIVVRPLRAEEYVLMALRRIKENYPKDPFQTEAYFREKILENDSLIKSNEGIFRTYYPNYQDTNRTQHQLMLFRVGDKVHKITFMKRLQERAEKEEKDSLKKQKPDSSFQFTNTFGGPAEILRSSNMTRKPEDFLDSAEIKNYKYTFAKSTSYGSSELMVIEFETKGKVNHKLEKGKIYMDVNSLAIVRIECGGRYIMPGIVKSIFFFLSIGVKNPNFASVYEFQKVEDRWYPKSIQTIINVTLTNNHLFRKDERSLFEIEQVFAVNELVTTNAAPIPPEKLYNTKKPMDKQVYNDKNLSWEEMNIIKR